MAKENPWKSNGFNGFIVDIQSPHCVMIGQALLEITDFGAQAADTTELEAKALGSCIPRCLLGGRVGSLQGTFFRGPSYPHLSTNMEHSVHWDLPGKPPWCVNSGIFCTWHRIFWQAYASLLGLLARLNAAAQAAIYHLQARGHWKNCTLQELFSLNPAAVKSMSIRKYKVAHPATVRLEMPHNKTCMKRRTLGK